MRRLLPIVAAVGLVSAAPPDAPIDLIRRGNAAFLAKDIDAAVELYSAAEDRAGDPGLVAFNKAAVLLRKDDFHGAEVLYARTLDDRACPADRAAKAWYNRGTCLLRQGGSAATFRSAIACFDRCLESPAADAPLKANARHNLEIAKLLWLEANKTAAKPESPNTPTREDEQPDPGRAPPTGLDPNAQDNGTDGNLKKEPRPTPMSVPMTGQAQRTGNETGAPIAGDVPNPQPLLNDDVSQKLSPEETRAYLRRAEGRMREERRGMLRTLYGADRPGVRDW
jgi:hypothetical protein